MKLPKQETKDMLLQAAKACGMTDWLWNESEQCLCKYHAELGLWYSDLYGYKICWNPLKDDGDALRLAVKLRIIHTNPPSMSNYIRASGVTWRRKIGTDEPIGGDPYAATRLAIVRVAAEIGKDME